MTVTASNHSAHLRKRSKGAPGESLLNQLAQQAAQAPTISPTQRIEVWTDDIVAPVAERVFGMKAGSNPPEWTEASAFDPDFQIYGWVQEVSGSRARILIHGITEMSDSSGDAWDGTQWRTSSQAPTSDYDPRMSLRLVLMGISGGAMVFFNGLGRWAPAPDRSEVIMGAVDWPSHNSGSLAVGKVIAADGRPATVFNPPLGVIAAVAGTSVTVRTAGSLAGVGSLDSGAHYLDPDAAGNTLAEGSATAGTSQRLWRVAANGVVAIQQAQGAFENRTQSASAPASGKIVARNGELATPYRLDRRPHGVCIGSAVGGALANDYVLQLSGPTELSGYTASNLYLDPSDSTAAALTTGTPADGDPSRAWRIGGDSLIQIEHQGHSKCWDVTAAGTISGPIAPNWSGIDASALIVELNMSASSNAKSTSTIRSGTPLWTYRANAHIAAGSGRITRHLDTITMEDGTSATASASGHTHDYDRAEPITTAARTTASIAPTANGWSMTLDISTTAGSITGTIEWDAATGDLTTTWDDSALSSGLFTALIKMHFSH